MALLTKPKFKIKRARLIEQKKFAKPMSCYDFYKTRVGWVLKHKQKDLTKPYNIAPIKVFWTMVKRRFPDANAKYDFIVIKIPTMKGYRVRFFDTEQDAGDLKSKKGLGVAGHTSLVSDEEWEDIISDDPKIKILWAGEVETDENKKIKAYSNTSGHFPTKGSKLFISAAKCLFVGNIKGGNKAWPWQIPVEILGAHQQFENLLKQMTMNELDDESYATIIDYGKSIGYFDSSLDDLDDQNSNGYIDYMYNKKQLYDYNNYNNYNNYNGIIDGQQHYMHNIEYMVIIIDILLLIALCCIIAVVMCILFGYTSYKFDKREQQRRKGGGYQNNNNKSNNNNNNNNNI